MAKIKSFGIFNENGSGSVYKTKEEFLNYLSDLIDTKIEELKDKDGEDVNYDIEISINDED